MWFKQVWRRRKRWKKQNPIGNVLDDGIYRIDGEICDVSTKKLVFKDLDGYAFNNKIYDIGGGEYLWTANTLRGWLYQVLSKKGCMGKIKERYMCVKDWNDIP